MSVEAIRMKGIVKRFGNFTANDHINLTVHKGEVHAILGENGAGKSTLMNVLYGIYQPNEGSIEIDGKPVKINGPEEAIKLGIGMVHQHFMLIQPFTVTENIILGSEPRKGLVVDKVSAREKIMELSERYGLKVDPDAKVEDISVGMQQRVEILKVLYRGARHLILDEPTSSLTPQEITELMEIIKNLTKDGKSVILITHKLKEITEAADFCTIIRQGKYIDTVEVDQVDENRLAEMMVGRNVEFKVDKKEQAPGEVVLDVENLHAKDYRGVDILNGLNLKVHKGEIVGLAGVDGNGQSELVEILTGLMKAESGKITVEGKDIFNKKPKEIFDDGVSSIPEDRQKHGLVMDFTVAENMILQNYDKPQFSKHGILNRSAISKFTNQLIDKFDIRPRGCENRLARQLSGGNQQKVLLAKWMFAEPDVLILDEPTRGIDVGAKYEIYQIINEMVSQGKAVVMISSELPELLGMCDRIYAMNEGRIVGEFNGKDATQEKIMSAILSSDNKTVKAG